MFLFVVAAVDREVGLRDYGAILRMDIQLLWQRLMWLRALGVCVSVFGWKQIEYKTMISLTCPCSQPRQIIIPEGARCRHWTFADFHFLVRFLALSIEYVVDWIVFAVCWPFFVFHAGISTKQIKAYESGWVKSFTSLHKRFVSVLTRINHIHTPLTHTATQSRLQPLETNFLHNPSSVLTQFVRIH